MTDSPEGQTALLIEMADLDDILDEVRPDPDTMPDNDLEASEHIGRLNAAEAMHREIVARSEVVIE